MQHATDKVTIFGYGSLMNLESLRTDVPNATGLRTAYINGFKRAFNKLDEIGWKSMYRELAGIPFCAVNISRGKDLDEVNGVVFDVELAYLDALKHRESGYELIEAPAYDFESGRSLGKCWVFSAQDCSGIYIIGEAAQQKYLEVCLDAAKSNGERFYEQFLGTTYVGDKTLAEIPALTPLALAQNS